MRGPPKRKRKCALLPTQPPKSPSTQHPNPRPSRHTNPPRSAPIPPSTTPSASSTSTTPAPMPLVPNPHPNRSRNQPSSPLTPTPSGPTGLKNQAQGRRPWGSRNYISMRSNGAREHEPKRSPPRVSPKGFPQPRLRPRPNHPPTPLRPPGSAPDPAQPPPATPATRSVHSSCPDMPAHSAADHPPSAPP